MIDQDQAHDAKTTLFLYVYELWSDEDEVNDAVTDSDFRFSATTTTPWIKVVHNAVRWGTIKDGPDGVSGNADDITWGGGTAPNDSDIVAIVEIDRMTNNAETEDGTITLTATDDEGATGTATITVDITDEDVPIPLTVDTSDPADGTPDAIGGTVRIMGVLREGNSLTMSFDYTKDPDLSSGDWVLVEYTWTVTNPADSSVVRTVTSYGSAEPLMLTQDDVGMQVSASVQYYQLAPGTGDIALAAAESGVPTGQNGGSATARGTVANAHDAGMANIVYTTGGTGGTTLMAEVAIMDEDGIDLDDSDDADPAVGDDRATAPVYTWQQSDNGVGGWSNVTDADTSDTMVTGTVAGKYYRLVVTYTDAQGASERIEGDAIKIGALAAKTAPTVNGSNAVGGTLIVNAAGGSVQWQRQVDPDGTAGNGDEYWADLPGATGNLTLTSAHAGMTLRALVTYTDANGATAIVATATSAVPAGSNTDPVSIDSHEIKVVVADQAANAPAVITTVEETVDLAALFQDADGDTLTFTDSGATEGLSGGNYLRFDANTGKLLYITDNQGGHDGGTDDGGGNVVSITITASDGGGGTDATSTVSIRLNVAPTDVTGDALTILENDRTGDTTLALDVQDENDDGDHGFGSYTWTVSDDRFMITPSTSDGSQATLSVKSTAKFNEAAFDDGGTSGSAANDTITLTITATDKAGDHMITHRVTVTVTDDTSDNPTGGEADQVPGLKDDEGGTTQDDRTDDDDAGNTDDDQDGGLPPPPDMSMMINDDLLEDFVLAIDDIDVA